MCKWIGEYRAITLTTGIDSLTGTSGDDTFIATNGGAGSNPTLNTGDQVDGGAGTDTLRITSVSNDTPVATLNNIEKVQIQQLTADSGNISGVNWTGVTEIINRNSSKDVSVVDLQANAKVSVVNGLGGEATSVTFASGKLGTAATATVAVNASGDKATAHDVKFNVAGTDVVTSLAVDATGSNFVNYTGASDKITTLTVTGEGTLSLAGATNELRKVSTVNASENTGGLTVDLSGVTAATLAVTGGSGKDVITANAATVETIDLGAGDDSLDVGAAGNVTTADTYNGGEGKDTLKITTAANANTAVTGKLNAQFSNFEVLGLTTVDADIDVSKWGVNELVVSGDVDDGGAGTAFAASGFTSGATVTLSRAGTQTDILNVGIKGATDAGSNDDVLNVKLAADLTGDATYKVGVNGVNTLNIDATDPDATTSTGIYTLALSSASNVGTINVTGKSALSLDSSGFGGTQGVTIASSATGDLTFVGTAFGDNITGGSGANTITGGNGNDTVNISASSAKQDTVSLKNILTNANADTVTGFVAGSATTADRVGIDVADTTDNALTFANATSAATVVNPNQAVTQFNVTASTAIIELGNAALGSNGDLSASTNGTELLKALASSGTASGITAETAGGGDKVYFVAYQGDNAYLYYADDAGGTNGLFEANEIALVGTLTDVDAGAFVAGNFAAL